MSIASKVGSMCELFVNMTAPLKRSPFQLCLYKVGSGCLAAVSAKQQSGMLGQALRCKFYSMMVNSLIPFNTLLYVSFLCTQLLIMHIRQHTIVLLMVSVFKLRLLLTGDAPSHYGAHK